MSVIGLDLSSTSTGICHRDGYTTTTAPKGDLLHRARRMRHDAVIATVAGDLVVIEAIATRHVQTAIAIATVHALVLDAIADTRHILMVSPASLKKFATAKGNSNKTAMLLAAKRDGWIDPPGATDDQADAWWLWVLGHATTGRWHVTETKYRTDVIASLKTLEPKT